MKVEIPRIAGVPAAFERLPEFAYNLWWSWHEEGRSLFRRLDLTLWRSTSHNPVKMLQQMPAARWEELLADETVLALYEEVLARFDRYMNSSQTWFQSHFPHLGEWRLAYFCAEFALHNSLPIYSGGLGLLAGDTCKEASDLGIPLVGIGSLYPEGYVKQRMESDGHQEAIYERFQTDQAPILPVLTGEGERLLVEVPVESRQVKVALWKIQVGRVPIFLMDTDIAENDPWDRDLSARLYGGDQQVRLRQEIVLGIGGIRVLRALGFRPSCYHLNEGHAAFAALELLKEQLQRGQSLEAALEQVRPQLAFTTHTPVKAGHDEFPFYMMEEYFRSYWGSMGISREAFLGLGKVPDANSFSMTVLALRCAGRANGVSRRHGEVSRQMWHTLWPELAPEQVPIVSITNGVHVPTWISSEMNQLFVQFLGPDWLLRHDEQELWEQIRQIPSQRLWEIHCLLKDKLALFIRERARRRWMGDHVTPGQMVAFGTLLDPQALTLGFARRFATYKRADLILTDLERLKRILHDPHRPVQIIFAGKAHPADEPGKYLLQRVFQICMSHDFGGRVAFIEDYDKHVAHHLLPGVDVWLNNPEPPKEASGTSGQKAALNGVLNLSVLDGWWCEGYNGKNGWAIEESPGQPREVIAEQLYQLLENQVVPLFYQRSSAGVPEGWVEMMKESIRSNAALFSTRRMLKEYLARLYGLSREEKLEEV